MAKESGNGKVKDVFGDIDPMRTRGGDVADWGSQPADTLLKLITTVTSRGGAVRFGYTRDGGAYSLGVYYGTGHRTFYCRAGEDVSAFLQQWIDFYQALPYTGGKSPD